MKKNSPFTLLLLMTCVILMPSGALMAQYWNLTGNSNTTSSHYIGTSNARSLPLATNATTRMLITSAGNIGVGTTSPSSRFHITGGTLLVSGATSTVPTLLNGPTDYYFYYQPLKGALRFGSKAGMPTCWDTTNMGLYSFAWGNSSMAKGINSISGGDYAMAYGRNSFALGQSAQSGGFCSMSVGFNTGAGGDYGFSHGFQTRAWGTFSFAKGEFIELDANYGAGFGQQLDVNSYNSFVIGRYNAVSGTTTSWISTQTLFVAGNGSSTARSNALTLLKNGNMTISGTLSQSSDVRLKQNISPLTNVLTKINAIQPIYYDFINKELHPGERQLGFSAQEIQQQFPELVKEDQNQFLAVDYASMSAVVLQAVKEQQTMIINLTKKLETLQNEINLLKSSAGDKSINENMALNVLSIVPNPASDKITIQSLNSSLTGSIKYRIVNYLGQEIVSGETLSDSRQNAEINIAGLAAGTYVIILNDGSSIAGSGTFIKQ